MEPIKKLIRSIFADAPSINWTEKQTIEYLKKKDLDPVEGIWEIAAGNYKIAIVADSSKPSTFIGFILKADSLYWMPGQIKMHVSKIEQQYNVLFYNIYHFAQETSMFLSEGVLI